MPFFSQLIGRPVVDTQGRDQGKLADMIVSIDAPYPIIKAISVTHGRKNVAIVVPWDQVQSLDNTIVVRMSLDSMVPHPAQPHDLFLGRDVLDRQIVDVDGHKIVRVNDLQLARTNGHYRLIGVEVGSQALLRRIGVQALTQRLGIRPQENFIAWQDVDTSRRVSSEIRLRVSQGDLARLHPADVADIVEKLSVNESVALFKTMDAETAAEALEEVSSETTASLLQNLTSDQAADILEEMSPDDAADVLGDLPHEKADELLGLMQQEDSDDLRTLLEYPEDSVGGLMTTEFVAVPHDITVAQALDVLRRSANDVEFLHTIFVVDTDVSPCLKGEISLRDLIVADPAARVDGVMHTAPATLHPSDSAEFAARQIAKYNTLAAPVTDEHNILVGIVTVDDAIDIILPTAWKKRIPRIFA